MTATISASTFDSLLSDPLAAEVIATNPELLEWARAHVEPDTQWGGAGWLNFRPRADRPELFDQQSSFYHARDMVSFCIGGNGSGTTEVALAKVANFILHVQPPPRRDTPFWIISNTYEQVSGVCWGEKLYGNQHIPLSEVDVPRIRWLNHGMNWPLSVPLKPWPESRGGHRDRNWMLEFKSFEQGRRALQARSIGGFCFSEQFPLELFQETLRGCRQYMYPGGQFAEFTPIEPDLCLWIEKIMEQQPKGWGFYRCNTELNRPNLASSWFENFFAAVPDEMRDTRMTGALATFEGVIYPAFMVGTHVLRGPFAIPDGGEHFRAIDWGASAEHPFVCLFGWRDPAGDWIIYDEYWNNSQTATLKDHADAINEMSQDWGWPAPGEPATTDWFRETFADPSRPGDFNTLGLYGIHASRANNSVYDGIDCVRSLLKPRITGSNGSTQYGPSRLRIHERCKHTIEEIRKYRWDRRAMQTQGGRTTAVARPVPLKREDDCCDAIRYLLFTAERGRGLILSSTSYSDYQKAHRTVQFDFGERAVGLAAREAVDGMNGNGHGGNGHANGSDRGHNGRR